MKKGRKPLQDQIFLKKEGDRWYQRNRSALQTPRNIQKDWPLKLLSALPVKPKKVLEVGCSTGWRLAEIQKQYRCACVGVDPSRQALREGQRAHPKVAFKRGLAASLPFKPTDRFDWVIVNFVLHWISRDWLLRSVAEIDRVVADNGYLLVADFLPNHPQKTRYHHLPHEKIFTYKLDYAGLLVATGLYKTVSRKVFDHETKRSGSHVPANRRAVCTLLKKSLGRYYLETPYSPARPLAEKE